MPRRAVPLALLAGALVGAAIALAATWLAWGRPGRVAAARLAALESSAAQVQAERERLHHELDDIVRERREMAATAEQLRTQVARELQRLEDLSAELAPPATDVEPSAPASP
jgi:gas vesicle protein